MKSKTFTEEELNSVSKKMVIKMYLQLAESFEKMTGNGNHPLPAQEKDWKAQ